MSGIWWDDDDYPDLKKKFDEAQVLLITQKHKKFSQAATLEFLIDFYEKRRTS